MKFSTALILSTLAASASAFAPSSQSSRSSLSTRHMASSERFDSSSIKGYYTNFDDARLEKDLPGSMNFDPLGFGDTQGGLFYQREAEIKVSYTSNYRLSNV